MTPGHFKLVYEEQCRRIDNLLLTKGDEYAPDTDRLANFKESAKFLRTTPKAVCLAFLTKQLISLVDMVSSEKVYTTERWNEKIGDSITYLHLLWALEKEARLTRAPDRGPIVVARGTSVIGCAPSDIQGP